MKKQYKKFLSILISAQIISFLVIGSLIVLIGHGLTESNKLSLQDAY